MTREEAIQFIDNIKHEEAGRAIGKEGFYAELIGYHIQALDMAIKALEQEPCTDAVSIRKDILKCRVGKIVAYNVEWLKKHWQMEMDIVCGVKPCDDAISREMALKECYDIVVDGERYRVIQEETLLGLPPVTQKSGKWIAHSDGGIWIKYYECSKCGKVHDTHSDFCPNCGAKMESEE